ncbi:MAG: hypothetical protein PHD32_02170 [Eubacteriales bacterium]|nr:hypothetical protein [Eubacteriales bacterium]
MVALVLVVSVLLAACSSGPDVTKLNASYSTLVEKYNAMATTANDNGWGANEEVATKLNAIADKISTIPAVIDDPSSYTQEQIDKLTTGCDDLCTWADTMADAVSQPYSAE